MRRNVAKKHADATAKYSYSAEDVERLTGGHVKLKTINNWVTNDYWVSQLQDPASGLARKYSRENIIEAVLASKLFVAGISRVRAKWFIENIDLANSAIAQDKTREWFYLLKMDFRDGFVDGFGAFQCDSTMIAEELEKDTNTNVFIFSASKIFRDLDALDHDSHGK
jgi:hypothetical protein